MEINNCVIFFEKLVMESEILDIWEFSKIHPVEGSAQGIIEIWLIIYRATQNPNTPNGDSTAESPKIHLLMDANHPALNCFYKRNSVMEKQFNHCHEAVPHLFVLGQPVLAKD